MRSALISALLIATVLVVAQAKPVPDADILKLLSKNYDHHTRPFGANKSLPDGGPVVVTLQLFIRHLEFHDESKEMQSQLTIRQKWNDSRLAYGTRYNKTVELPAEIRIAGSGAFSPWRPDLFLQNEKRSSKHSFGNELLIVGKDGNVMMSNRVSVDFFCKGTNFHAFPRDQHVCEMGFASYGFTTEDIVYQWNEKPLEVKKEVNDTSYDGYRLKSYSNHSVTTTSETGEYGSLYGKFTFLRTDVQPMVVHMYLPTALLVLVSWVSFFLPKREMAARLLLILIPLLLVILIARDPVIKAPVVDYNKGDDTWFIWCLIFIFAALLQFLLMAVLYGRELNTASDTQKNDNGYKCFPTGNLKSDVCDFVARILFPLAFLVFLIAYFSVY